MEEVRKNPGEIVRYGRDLLMRFAERYTAMPADLPQIEGVILPYDDPQRAVISEVSGRSIESDWRSGRDAPTGQQQG